MRSRFFYCCLFLLSMLGWILADARRGIETLDDREVRHHVKKAIQSSATKFYEKLKNKDHVKIATKYHVLERAKPSIHRHFRRVQAVQDKNLKHQVVFALKMNNMDHVKAILYDISDPNSVNYGKHLTGEEVSALVRNPDSVNHLLRYFDMHGITVLDRTLNDEFITTEASVYTLENMFNTEFFEYEVLTDPSQRVIRTEEYSLPSYLTDHVTAVFNTVHFPDMQSISKRIPKKQITLSESAVSLQSNIIAKYVTPALINRVYGVASNIGSPLASQAVYETINQFYSPADLEKFQKRFELTVEPVAKVIGGHNSDKACKEDGGDKCVEANLDIQYLMATAQQVPSTYYYWSGKDFMVQWLIEVSKMESPPLVFSISYGSDEVDLPDSYGSTFDAVAIRLGVRGVTLVASSGDDGAISSNARKNALHCGYAPSFPASSPYVVAVGGTMGPENGHAEVVCQADLDGDITSGGGFSAMYPMPDWQLNATSAYFRRVSGTKDEPVKGYNRFGRGIPDISLLAHNYVITLGGNFSVVSGTSASSPVFAGMISLVNSARLHAGKSALGWVNPALYQLGHLFIRDITSGDNHCVASGTVCCAQGFNAVPGWDPVTGLGSIDFTKFKNTLSALGDNFNHPTMRPSPGPGQPSFQPTLSPVSDPTEQPTATPTMGPGWFYMNQFQEEDCRGSITAVSAVPAGKCMIEYDKDKKPIGSRRYECLADSAVLGYFTDLHCAQRYLVAEEQYFFGCAYKVEDYYYASSYYSMELTCSQQASMPPLPVFDGTYAVESSFNSPTDCDAGTLSSVDATLQKHCFDLESEGMSYKIVFPKIYIYTGSNCHKLKTTDDLSTQCTEEALEDDYYSDDDQAARRISALDQRLTQQYDDDGIETGFVELYSAWNNGHYTIDTTAPTIIPTQLPSLEPTASVQNTTVPSFSPSEMPTLQPTVGEPTSVPSQVPTVLKPSSVPSQGPTLELTAMPTADISTLSPSIANTSSPSLNPSQAATAVPTVPPSMLSDGSDEEDDKDKNKSAAPTTMPTPASSDVPSTAYPTTTNSGSSEEENESDKSKRPTLSPNSPPAQSNAPTASSSSSSEEEDETKKTKSPTPPPSFRPSSDSRAPSTSAPTLSVADSNSKGEVKITIDQVLNGVSYEQWNQDPDNCFLVLQTTIVNVNPSVQISGIKLKSVSPYIASPGRRLLLGVVAAVNVTYDLIVDAKHSSYANTGETFSVVKETLMESVNDGKFDDALFATATSYQVLTMLGVTSSLLVITNVETMPSSSTSSDEAASAPPPATTAVVILFGFLAVVVASVVYYYQSKKSAAKSGNNSAYNQVSLESDSTHSSVNPLSAKVADEDEEIEIELTNRASHSGYGLVSNPMAAESAHGLV